MPGIYLLKFHLHNIRWKQLYLHRMLGGELKCKLILSHLTFILTPQPSLDRHSGFSLLPPNEPELNLLSRQQQR
jgi:hypothetical protein